MASKQKEQARSAPAAPLHEQYLARLKRNRLVAVLLVAASIVAGLASFTDSARKLVAVFVSSPQRPEDARAELTKLSLPYTSTAFVAAAAGGDAVAVKLYLAAGMSTEEESARDPTTALVEAARADRPEIVEQLLKAKADVNHRVPQWGSALEAAAAMGNARVAELLLAHKPEARAIDGAFIDASHAGRLALLRLLQQHGARVPQLATRALFSAAGNTRSPEPAMAETAAFLLQAGADLKAREDESRWTLLHRAAYSGHTAVVALLLKHGADPNALDTQGCTPLWWAAGVGRFDNAALLLKNGADATLKSHDGTTVLQRARHNQDEPMIALLSAKPGP